MASGQEDDLLLGSFLVNAISYGVLGLIAVVLSAGALVRAWKAFAYLWWLKLLLIRSSGWGSSSSTRCWCS